MEMVTVTNEGSELFEVEYCCPYHESGKGKCLAGTSNYYPDTKRKKVFCAGDDHENCAIFLAKVLRGGGLKSKRKVGILKPSLFDK